MGMGREMIDWDKPIETVDGRGAKVLSRGYWRKGEIYCVVAVEDPETGDSKILIVNPTTGYGQAAPVALNASIRNVRVKREGWVLKRKGMNILGDYRVHETEKQAWEACSDDGEPLRIEWEE